VLPLVSRGAPGSGRGDDVAVFEGKDATGETLRLTYRQRSPDTLEALLEKAGTKQTFAYRRK
jgi:hypothetical protein